MKKQTFLHYLGGKWCLAPWIISHFPFHCCYVEPFGGGGSVLLRKTPAPIEVYNDINKEIVNLFQVLREDNFKLLQLLRLTPFSREELRRSKTPSILRIEQARRTLIRYRYSRNPERINYDTTIKTSSLRSFSMQWKNFVDNDLPWIIDRLRSVTIENRDATKIIDFYDKPDTLYYIDPPYDPKISSITYRSNYSTEQIISLSKLLQNIQGFVVISGCRSDLWDNLFSWCIRRDKQTRNA